jgi:ATP-dependent Clp protease ATP-binding subunit ClpC
MVLALEEARALDHDVIGTEHVLVGIIREADGAGAHVLEQLGVSITAVREKIQERRSPSVNSTRDTLPFTPRAKKALELSLHEAVALRHEYIGTEHLLLGLVGEGQGHGAEILMELGTTAGLIRQQTIEVIAAGDYAPEVSKAASGVKSRLHVLVRRGRINRPPG